MQASRLLYDNFTGSRACVENCGGENKARASQTRLGQVVTGLVFKRKSSHSQDAMEDKEQELMTICGMAMGAMITWSSLATLR